MQKFTPDACFNLKVRSLYMLGNITNSTNTAPILHTPGHKYLNFLSLDFDGRIDLILLFKSGLIQIHYNKIPSSRSKLITPNGHATFPFDFY